MAGNRPSTEAYVWSALSLITLLSGLGLILFVVGKFDYLGWKGEGSGSHVMHSAPPALKLTPSQWATGWFFGVVALLFLVQSFLGGVLAHYRVETGAFYGLDIARWLPYTLARTWHLQLAIFWIATAWVGGGLFLASWVGGEEPRHQKTGVYALLGALVVVVVGSLVGEFLGINDKLGQLWFWFGHQGSEYLDLGRLWQFLLAVGLLFWLFLMFRALRPAFKSPDKRELSSLFLYAAVAIPFFYLPALFYGPHTNFAVIDNWRFWIIHLWVEGFFELFATVLVAIMFHQMGMVSTKTATRLIYLDAILYLSAGIIGTGHHWYFTGQGTLNMGLGVVLLRDGGCASNASDSGRLGFHQTEESAVFHLRPGFSVEPEVVHLLPHGRGGLELRWRGDLRIPDQPADRVLLRGGHVAHRQSRACRNVWCFWDVGLSGLGLLLAGHAIRWHLERDGEVHPSGLLGCQRGPRAYDHPGFVPRRSNPALGFHRQRLLARAPLDISDGRHLPQAGMVADGGGHGLSLCRRPAHYSGRIAQRVEKGSLSHAVKAEPHRIPANNQWWKARVTATPLLATG